MLSFKLSSLLRESGVCSLWWIVLLMGLSWFGVPSKSEMSTCAWERGQFSKSISPSWVGGFDAKVGAVVKSSEA